MKCPCEDCLCVPICRHKRYIPLIKCSILNNYIMKGSISTPAYKMDRIITILEPSKWKYTHRKHKGKKQIIISSPNREHSEI